MLADPLMDPVIVVFPFEKTAVLSTGALWDWLAPEARVMPPPALP